MPCLLIVYSSCHLTISTQHAYTLCVSLSFSLTHMLCLVCSCCNHHTISTPTHTNTYVVCHIYIDRLLIVYPSCDTTITTHTHTHTLPHIACLVCALCNHHVTMPSPLTHTHTHTYVVHHEYITRLLIVSPSCDTTITTHTNTHTHTYSLPRLRIV